MTVSYAKLREIADHASAAANESKQTESNMSYILKATSAHGMRTIGNAETIEGAKAMIPADIVFMEEDNENPGYFDAFCANGEIYVIEPR